MTRLILALALLPGLAFAGGTNFTPANTATATLYTPATGANWTDPDPEAVAAALDTLAARVPAAGALGGSTGADDNRVLRADGTGAATLQASALICDDLGNLSGVAGLTLSGSVTLSTGGATVDGVDVGAIPATYQPLHALLTSLAALDGTGGDLGVYLTAANTSATFALTAAGRAILDDADATAQRATLGLGALATASDAVGVPYAPAIGADWTNPDPEDAAAGLDDLALRLTAEEAVDQSGTGACGASQWASAVNSDAAPTCTQPAFSDVSGAVTDGQVPDGITVTLAATATALAVNPADCAADSLANSIAASGALTCYAVPDCDNATTSKLLYDTTAHAFSCGTDQAGGGAVDAAAVTYTPDDLDSWTPDPADVAAALNQSSARVLVLEAFDATLGALATGGDATDVPYTPTTGGDWTNPDPTDAGGALDTLASRVVAVESASYQPLDALLTSVAAIDGTGGDKGVYFTAADTAATFALTAFGRSLADDANAAAGLSTLGAQASDATLTALAATTWTAGTELVTRTAADTFGAVNIGTAANGVLQLDADAKIPAGVSPSSTATWSLLDYDADRDQGTGDASANGWTEAGGTHAIATDGGIEHHGITGTSGVTATISKTFTLTSAHSWEAVVETYVTSTTSLQHTVSVYDGTKIVSVEMTSTGVTIAGPGAPSASFDATLNKWVTLTIRKVGDSDGVVEVWIGPYPLGVVNYTDLTANATASSIKLGKATTTSAVEIKIRQARLNSGLANPLPSVRYANTARGR